MSFATGHDVIRTVETLVEKVFGDLLPEETAPPPFLQMPYELAMSRYGSDKPDVRIDMEASLINHRSDLR